MLNAKEPRRLRCSLCVAQGNEAITVSDEVLITRHFVSRLRHGEKLVMKSLVRVRRRILHILYASGYGDGCLIPRRRRRRGDGNHRGIAESSAWRDAGSEAAWCAGVWEVMLCCVGGREMRMDGSKEGRVGGEQR